MDLSGNPDRIVIYPSQAKMLLVLLGSIAFVVIGVWSGISSLAREVVFWSIASYLSVSFFAVCGFYAAYRLVIRRPALEVDTTGITDAASAFGLRHLSWEEIDYVLLYKYAGQSMLGIIPRNLDIFLSRQPVVRRFFIKLNLALGCAPINIPQVGLSMELAELARLFQNRYGVCVEGDV